MHADQESAELLEALRVQSMSDIQRSAWLRDVWGKTQRNAAAFVAQALAAFGVEYALTGGTAMAVHGFSRATQDIDLPLLVDADNHARLLRALASLPRNAKALGALRREWMDKGRSTALEGKIYIDLLYVAAGQSFESPKPHLHTVFFDRQPAVIRDVDGLLLTKKTSREVDIPDRLKRERLSNALRMQAASAERGPQ